MADEVAHRYGAQESTLGADAAAVAAEQGYSLALDPDPNRNSFIRSDQYSFIRTGVPALSLKVGFLRGSAEAKMQKDWLTARYHAPSDDLTQPVNMETAHSLHASQCLRGSCASPSDGVNTSWKLVLAPMLKSAGSMIEVKCCTLSGTASVNSLACCRVLRRLLVIGKNATARDPECLPQRAFVRTSGASEAGFSNHSAP